MKVTQAGLGRDPEVGTQVEASGVHLSSVSLPACPEAH